MMTLSPRFFRGLGLRCDVAPIAAAQAFRHALCRPFASRGGHGAGRRGRRRRGDRGLAARRRRRPGGSARPGGNPQPIRPPRGRDRGRCTDTDQTPKPPLARAQGVVSGPAGRGLGVGPARGGCRQARQRSFAHAILSTSGRVGVAVVSRRTRRHAVVFPQRGRTAQQAERTALVDELDRAVAEFDRLVTATPA